MDAYDLVVSVFALNNRYGFAVTIKSGGIERERLVKSILSGYPSPVLKAVRIRPHYLHGDSPRLDYALNTLLCNLVLRQWSPDGVLTWDFPKSPKEYFEENIRPRLLEGEFSQLEAFVQSLC